MFVSTTQCVRFGVFKIKIFLSLKVNFDSITDEEFEVNNNVSIKPPICSNCDLIIFIAWTIWSLPNIMLVKGQSSTLSTFAGITSSSSLKVSTVGALGQNLNLFAGRVKKTDLNGGDDDDEDDGDFKYDEVHG